MGSKSSGNHNVQKMTPAQRKAAVKAYNAAEKKKKGKKNMEVGKIARKYGVSNQYIHKLVKESNITVDN